MTLPKLSFQTSTLLRIAKGFFEGHRSPMPLLLLGPLRWGNGEGQRSQVLSGLLGAKSDLWLFLCEPWLLRKVSHIWSLFSPSQDPGWASSPSRLREVPASKTVSFPLQGNSGTSLTCTLTLTTRYLKTPSRCAHQLAPSQCPTQAPGATTSATLPGPSSTPPSTP